MTGNPSERDDMDFDDEAGFVIDSDVDSTAPPHPLDEVFAEVDRELAKRRGMWTEAEAKFNDAESTLDDEEVFVLEDEAFDCAVEDAAADASPLTASPSPAASEPDDGEMRVTVGGTDAVFSADKSMFDVDVASEAEAASAEIPGEAVPDASADEDSEGELSMLDAIDASSAELEIIAEAEDPFARLGAAGSAEGDDRAESTEGDDWSPSMESMETGSPSLHLHETTWDGAQTEATAAAFAEDVGEDETAQLEDQLEDPLDAEGTEDDFDPIYGDARQDEGDVDAELSDATESEPDYAEYEEAYAEADPALVVIGAPVRARRRAWRVFAAAALLLVAAGGTLAVARPDLVGLADPVRLVDRVEIARPMIDVVVAPPTPVVEPTPDLVVAVTPAPPPVVEPPVVEPPVVEPPVVTRPVPPVPVAIAPPVPVTPEAPPSGVLAPSNDLSRVGEDLEVRVAEAPVRGRVHELADGIATGNQAFAQLKNLNFFVGRVKAMDANFITLALDPGEITLAFEELTAIVPLASEEYRMMQGGQESFVRLRNSNRLFGRILANGGIADNIVIEVQKNLVTIPRHAIEEIGGQSALGVQVLQDDGGDWVERLLRKRNAEAGRTVLPTTGAESPRPGK